IDAKLTKDIDLSKGGNPSHWTPIGQYTTNTPDGYAGSFDGGGFTVSGYIVASADAVSADIDILAAGFFGLVGQSAEIRGLTVGGVVSVDISGNKAIHAGGIAGLNSGTITDCASGGTVTASGGSDYNNAGGITGYNYYGTITNNVHSGGVSAFGGAINNGAGGIAGYNDYGPITNNAHSGGDVSASGGSDSYAGGIVGYNDTDNKVNIFNSCWLAYDGLKAVGNETTVSADVLSLDAAEMQKVVTTVLPVERRLSVEIGGSAPALISYPGKVDDMTGYLSVSGDISVASPDIAGISNRWPCTVSGIKPGVTAVSFDIDLRYTDFSDKDNLKPLAKSCVTDPLCFTVAVGEVLVAGVILDLTELALKIGESKKLTATVKPENATDKAVAWTSADPAVVAVDDTGKVTALSAGTTVITAKAGGKSAACAVTVVQPKRGGSGHGCAAGLGALSMLALIPLWLRRKKR
ncbi:MAG: Ig-like domain-containing protein, partial [Synergistaceae bacterium]|nr:Ig-like domain-containing protein [Synergistaceae bacterium]